MTPVQLFQILLIWAVSQTPHHHGLAAAAIDELSPVDVIEVTDRACNPESLARTADETYCNKYYVCSSGVYVGQYCPTGMAFDYGLQGCRLRNAVDCSRRPLIFDAVGGSSSSSMASSNPAPHLVSASHSAPMASSTDQTQNVAHGHHVSDQSMLTLPAGAQLIIPVGSAIILPAGTMIQYQPGTVLKEDVTGMAGHQMSHGTASPMEATHSHGGSGAHSHS